MRVRSGMVFAMLAALAIGGCSAATAGGGGGGSLVSPTGKTYEPGIRPRDTRFSQAATLAIAQQRYEEGLTQAREGIASDPENAMHYYLAGEAAAGLGDYELADSMWVAAEQIYPAYELEVEPSRESAWARAFNEGVEAYNSGNVEGAIEAWTRAHQIYKLRPEAGQNLAVLLTQEERYDEAVEVYRETIANLDLEPATRIIDETEQAERDQARQTMVDSLAEILVFTGRFAEAEQLIREQLARDPENVELRTRLAAAIAGQGRDAEAAEIYTELLSVPNLAPADLFNIGVVLFQSEDFPRAAQAFERATQRIPDWRDAWYNWANSLYAEAEQNAEAWARLLPVAQRTVELDPLNDNSSLILARAYRETGDNARSLETLQANEAYPIYVDNLQMAPSPDQTIVQGTVTGNAAAQGTPVNLRFSFYSDTGQLLGTETVTINAPARDATANFAVTFGQPSEAYKYELVQ